MPNYALDTVVAGAPSGAGAANGCILDRARELAYLVDANRVGVARVNLATLLVEDVGLISPAIGANTTNTAGQYTVDVDGFLWTSGASGTVKLFKINPTTFAQVLSVTSPFGFAQVLVGLMTYGNFIVGYGLTNPQAGLVVVRSSDATVIGSNLIGPATGFTSLDRNVLSAPVLDGNGNVYFIFRDSATENWWIQRVNILGNVSGGAFTDVSLYAFTGNASTIGHGVGCAWNQGDNSLLVYTSTGAFLKFSLSTFTIVQSVGGVGNPLYYISGTSYEAGYSASCALPAGQIQDGLFRIPTTESTGNIVTAYDASAYTVSKVYDFSKWGAGLNIGTASSWQFDGSNDTICMSPTSNSTWKLERLHLDLATSVRVSQYGVEVAIANGKPFAPPQGSSVRQGLIWRRGV